MENKNLTGIEEMVVALKSAIDDFKRSAEGKVVSDWGAGMLAAMERFHDKAVQFAEIEREERAKQKPPQITSGDISDWMIHRDAFKKWLMEQR